LCFAKQAKFRETRVVFRFVSCFAKQKKGCEMETLIFVVKFSRKTKIYFRENFAKMRKRKFSFQPYPKHIFKAYDWQSNPITCIKY
jgi:hypothetical protein